MNHSDHSEQHSAPREVTPQDLDQWAMSADGPVALYLRQHLVPVESIDGIPAVIYPPTYADIGYCIDTLADGTKVALVDSVGSQANRMEVIFLAKNSETANTGNARFVPQVAIKFQRKDPETGAVTIETRSVLECAHRIADAVVMASPTLAPSVKTAFKSLRSSGDCGPLCAIAPTSLVFGVWDSRGGSGEKRPRLVRALIRAWDVETLHSAAQFNSIWKLLDEDQRSELEKEEAKTKKKKLSDVGLKDAPAVFRKTKDGVAKYLNGSVNPNAQVLGGVLVKDRIQREITVNLVALRGLRGSNQDSTRAIRKYLLGLSLLAAIEEIDLFLREGCNLRFAENDKWFQVPRRGTPEAIDFSGSTARTLIEEYTEQAFREFKELHESWLPSEINHLFDIKAAKQLLAKAVPEDSEED